MSQKEPLDSDFFIHTASAETSPRNHESHPPEDALLSLLSGDLADEQRSQLHAHLATCDACHTRWKSLKTHLTEEALSLRERSSVPSLAATIQKSRGVTARSLPWWQFLFEKRIFGAAGTVALASSAAALVLAFVVLIPIFQNSSQRTYEQIEMLSNDILTLQNQIQWSMPVASPITNGFPIQGITEELLFTYDWDDLVAYTSVAGDTWQRIAEAQLGNRSLWPLLWVLNRDSVGVSEELETGDVLRLPRKRLSE